MELNTVNSNEEVGMREQDFLKKRIGNVLAVGRGHPVELISNVNKWFFFLIMVKPPRLLETVIENKIFAPTHKVENLELE